MAVTDAPVERTEQVNGLNLHYLDWGGTGYRNLLMLHGITGNARHWDNFGPKWAQHNRVIALDQRGHGDSDWAKEGYAVWSFASDIYEFVRKLDLAPLDAIGHSLGARNLIPFAGDHSNMLSHLILTDCGPELPREGARNNNQRMGARPTFFRSWQDAEAYYRGLSPMWLVEPPGQEHLEQVMKYSLRTNYSGKIVWKHDLELFWITGSWGLKEVPYLWEQCAKITCKTLIAHGELSDVLTPELIDRMLAVMPNATVHRFEGASHNILLDSPEEYEQVVRDFLKS